MSTLKLDANDKRSATWLKIKKHLTEQLDLLRRKNDNEYDAVETAGLRGQIAHAKALLEAGGAADSEEQPE